MYALTPINLQYIHTSIHVYTFAPIHLQYIHTLVHVYTLTPIVRTYNSNTLISNGRLTLKVNSQKCKVFMDQSK